MRIVSFRSLTLLFAIVLVAAMPVAAEKEPQAGTERHGRESRSRPVRPRRAGRGSKDEPSQPAEGPAATGPENDRPYWRRNFFKRIGGDQKFLVTTWWRAELGRPWFYAPLTVATVGAITSDAESSGPDLRLERSVESRTGPHDARVAEALSRFGDGPVGAALLGGTYLIGRLSHNDRLAEASSLSAEALLNTAIWSGTLKRVTRRTRPAGGAHGDFFASGGEAGVEIGSFPSGHAMGAFAVATVFAEEYRHKRWVRWACYSTAGLIGASRVELGRHFPSDVATGALLGHSIGRMIMVRRRGAEGGVFDRLQPTFEPARRGYGLTYSYSW